MRRALIALLAGGALLASAAPAAAKVYCVPSSVAGCGQAVASLQTALNDAAADSSADTIEIAAGTFMNGNCASGGLSYAGSNPVMIAGAGIGKTILTCPADYDNSYNYYRIVELSGGATLTGVTVQLPAGDSGRGMEVDGTAVANGIALQSAPTATNTIGAVVDGGTIKDSTISVPTADTEDEAIQTYDGALLDGLTVSAGGAAIVTSSPTTISHSILSAPQVITDEGQDGGTVDVYDSLLDMSTGSSPQWGLSTYDTNSNVGLLSITARNDTIVGGGTGSAGVEAESENPGTTSSVSLTDSVISGPSTALERFAIAGTTATLTTSYSDYPAGTYTGTGTGSTTETNDLHVAPDFLNPAMGEYEPAPGSPLIDAGTPGGLSAGEPTTDLAGNPRILAGNGSCTARRDIGAYEYAPSLPASAHTVTDGGTPGTPITFTATGCSIDPSLSVTYSWSFDDGATAVGATVTHAFATPGLHHATVMVRDSAGRTGTATASVEISSPPPPPSKPALSKLSLSHKRFLAKAGAKLGYVDSVAATAHFTLLSKGVMHDGKCVASFKHQHGKPRSCWRKLKSFSHQDQAGTNSAALPVRGLPPGSYELSAYSVGANGRSRTVTIEFVILRPKRR